jgi:hypothetical protein
VGGSSELACLLFGNAVVLTDRVPERYRADPPMMPLTQFVKTARQLERY